jgi:hypothetical protein
MFLPLSQISPFFLRRLATTERRRRSWDPAVLELERWSWSWSWCGAVLKFSFIADIWCWFWCCPTHTHFMFPDRGR